MNWSGSHSEPKQEQEMAESQEPSSSRSETPADPGAANASTTGASPPDAMEGPSAPRNSAKHEIATTRPPESSSMGSSPRQHTRASRKRPLADAEGSDAEDAAADVPAARPAAAVAAPVPSRRVHVPSRPSGAGSSARPPGKAASPEASRSSLGLPPQAIPLRPSQRDSATASQGKAVPRRSSDHPKRGSTLRQTYNFLADPEKQPALVDKSESGGSGHFDPTNQMILRLEYLSEKDVKWAIFFIHMAEFIGLAVLILYLVAKLLTDDNYFIRNNTLVVVNLCVGVLLWLAVMEVFVIYIQHVVRTNRLRRQWSYRRYRTTVVLLVETISQIINLCFFILPNAYLLARPCGWRDPIVLWSSFVSWSCWNTLFLVLVVRVHNINLWLDKDGQPRGGRIDATIIDAPWMVHTPKLLLWAAGEAFKAVAITVILRESSLRPYYVPPGTEGDCRLWLFECHHSPIAQIMLILESAVLLIYLILFLYYLARSFRQLSTRNFRDFRMSNQSVRLILRTRLGAIIFFVASLICFYYVHLGSCATWVSSELGYLPMHIVMSTIVVVMLYWFMPKDPDAQDQVLQAWLQEFAWTEAEKLQKWKLRAGNLRLTSAALHELNKEPMFCFESAIKLYYYSHIIYHYDKLQGFKSSGPDQKRDEVTHIGIFRRKLAQSFGHLRSQNGDTADAAGSAGAAGAEEGDSGSISGQPLADGPVTDSNLATGPNAGATAAKLKAKSNGGPGSGSVHGSKNPRSTWGQSRMEDMSLDTALRLYDLERMEVLWERRHDSMALLAWGANRIVVVFRGTNSLKNVLADLEAWQTPFPPNQTGNHFWERPAVHNGFYQSYTANDFGRKIVRRVCELITSNDWDWTKIYCTGHSLGGALAMLAAYDISRAMEWVSKPTKVICYTFGAPRIGNYAFAHTYDKMVPETWNVVNDQDAVARRCKLCFLYKRPGQRVIVNRRGDMLVRPTFIELTLSQTPLTTSVTDHFLLSYRDALAEICRAQMNRRKRLEGGLAGVLSLLEGDGFVRGILEPAGLTMEELSRPSVLNSVRRLNVPPPVDKIVPPRPKTSTGAPVPPPSAFQAATSLESDNDAQEEVQHAFLNRSSSSSSSASYKTAYAQSFASSQSMDDVTMPGVPGAGSTLGSARPSAQSMEDVTAPSTGSIPGTGGSLGSVQPTSNRDTTASGASSWPGMDSGPGAAQTSGDTDISAAGIAHEAQSRASDGAPRSRDAEASAASAAHEGSGKAAASVAGNAEDAKGRAHLHLNGHGVESSEQDSAAGMGRSLVSAKLRSVGSFPGFWQGTGTNGAALPAAAAAGAATGAAAAEAHSGSASQPADTAHVPDAESSHAAANPAATASSMAPNEAQRAVASQAQKAPAGASTQERSKSASSSAPFDAESGRQPADVDAQPGKGGHDLSVAAGYTGPPGLLKRGDGMSGQRAIEALLKAQRRGGSVAPEVRIAAAHALACNAADAKRQRDARRASREAAQSPASTGARDIQPPGMREAAASETSDSMRTPRGADPGIAMQSSSPPKTAGMLETQPNTPHPYRINPEFYRAGSGGAPPPGPGTVRFADTDPATAGAVEGDAAVPEPGTHEPPAGTSKRQATGEDWQPMEKRSGSWLGWLPWSRASGSPKADALGSAERGESFQGAAADGSSQDATSSTADSSAIAALAGTATARSSDHHSGPAHADGPNNVASGTSAEPVAALLPAVGTEPPQEDGGTRDSAAAGGLGQAKHSKHLQEPRHSESGRASEFGGPITPERAEAPRKPGTEAPAAHADQTLPSLAAPQPEQQAPSESATAWRLSILPGAAAVADSSASSGVGSSGAAWAGNGHADDSAEDSSYAAFYHDMPEEPASQASRRTAESGQRRAAGTGGLTLPDGETISPRADLAEEASQKHADGAAQAAALGSQAGTGLATTRGSLSEPTEHFAAVSDLSVQGVLAGQPGSATPFRFTGSESAPTTPTRSQKRRPGKRTSQLSTAGLKGNALQDRSIFGPNKYQQDAGSEEDTSPRTRAMSRYLSSRQSSGALISPPESQTVTPEKPRAVSPVVDTPARPRQEQATMPDHSSPPRVRRKATPRELAEQFRGHGLKQAEWAPIPIYWAKDGSQAAPADP